MSEPATVHTTARRTRLRPGAEATYVDLHATVPEPVHAALRASGVLRWQIWRDGSSLFHLIDTTDGYDAMLAAIEHLLPVDAAWDELIESLLDPAPEADRLLGLVWTMDAAGQHPGEAGAVTGAPATR